MYTLCFIMKNRLKPDTGKTAEKACIRSVPSAIHKTKTPNTALVKRSVV